MNRCICTLLKYIHVHIFRSMYTITVVIVLLGVSVTYASVCCFPKQYEANQGIMKATVKNGQLSIMSVSIRDNKTWKQTRTNKQKCKLTRSVSCGRQYSTWSITWKYLLPSDIFFYECRLLRVSFRNTLASGALMLFNFGKSLIS